MMVDSPDEGARGARIRARFEMAITPNDFRRLVPLLPGADHARLEAMSASHEAGGQRWRLTLSHARARPLGRLCVPVADVEIELTGYNQVEAQRFLDRFHLVFRRGGG